MSRSFVTAALASTLSLAFALTACSGGTEPTDTGPTDTAADIASSDTASDTPVTDTPTDTPSAMCTADRDCDDTMFCNGAERCSPGATGANSRGCVPASPANPCSAGQTCNEATDRCDAPCDTMGDVDGDGHRSMACGGDDCDDNDANRFPGHPEVCDAMHDEDCDPATFGTTDSDGDTYIAAMCCNTNGTAMNCGNDCNDSAPSIHPTATEACNGFDDNCNGMIDESAPMISYYPDCDADTYGDRTAVPVTGCSPPTTPPTCPAGSTGAMWRMDNTDCDDHVGSTHPFATELCDNVDNDCDGTTDDGAAANCPMRSNVMTFTCTAGVCGIAQCLTNYADCDGLTASGCEVNTGTDPGNCGSCGNACVAPGGGSTACTMSVCASSCTAGLHLCSGACASNNGTASCGTSCMPCPVPANAMATCDGIACGSACLSGFATMSGRCDLYAPRPMAPISTTHVGSRRPAFFMQLPGSAAMAGMPGYGSGGRVQICRDRACTMIVATADVTGTLGTLVSATPSTDLPVGALYWRTVGLQGGNAGLTASATWEITVDARAITSDNQHSLGGNHDLNGDGIPDVVIGAYGAVGGGRVYVYYGTGSGTGLPATPSLTISAPEPTVAQDFGGVVRFVYDVNGDGYGDLVVGAPTPVAGGGHGSAYLFLGGPAGLATTPYDTLYDGMGGSCGDQVAALGDNDSPPDGFGDFVVGNSSTESATWWRGTAMHSFMIGNDMVQLGIGASNVATQMRYRGSFFFGSRDYNTLIRHEFPGVGMMFGGGGPGVGELIVSSDLTGDGIAEVISASLIPSQALMIWERGEEGGAMPYSWNTPQSLGAGGDLNHDGTDDLVAGVQISTRIAAGWCPGAPGGGGLVAGTCATLPMPAGDTQHGRSAVIGGDVNGDGYADAFFGGAGSGTGGGVVYQYNGSATGLTAMPTRTIAAPAGEATFGIAVE